MISEGFPTIFRRCSEDFRGVSDDEPRGCRGFPKMFRRFPDDDPRGSEDVPKISRAVPEGAPRGPRGVLGRGRSIGGLSGKSGGTSGKVRSAGELHFRLFCGS